MEIGPKACQRYHEVKQDVLLQISGIVLANDSAIADPTRTLDLESIPGISGIETTREKT